MRRIEQIPWTDEERAQLRRLHENGIGQTQMGRLLGRTKNSVHRQLSNMGLCRSDRNPAQPKRPGAHPKTATLLRAGRTTLPPLPSLSMRGDGEREPWDGTGWPPPEEYWP